MADIEVIQNREAAEEFIRVVQEQHGGVLTDFHGEVQFIDREFFNCRETE